MKIILPYISGSGVALNHIAKVCYEGYLKGIAEIDYAISNYQSPPGFEIAKKWGIVCIGIPFCKDVNDTTKAWHDRILRNSFWSRMPDIIIFAGFDIDLQIPGYEGKIIHIADSYPAEMIDEKLRKAIPDTILPQPLAGAVSNSVDENEPASRRVDDQGLSGDSGTTATTN